MVEQMARGLRQCDRVVGRDQHCVAAAGFGDRGRRSPALHRLGERAAHRRIDAGPHQVAESLHVGLQHAPGLHVGAALRRAAGLAPWPVVADDVDAVEALHELRVQAADQVRQDRVDEVVRRPRQSCRSIRTSLRRAEEALPPFAAHAVVLHVAEQADRYSANSAAPSSRPSTPLGIEQCVDLGAGQHRPGRR
jgi:hypothetical protein